MGSWLPGFVLMPLIGMERTLHVGIVLNMLLALAMLLAMRAIGRIDGIHYALGYCGHGLGIATYVGTEVGKLLSGEISTSPFLEIPHPTRFFYLGNPWFIPLAARYYRLVDWLS